MHNQEVETWTGRSSGEIFRDGREVACNSEHDILGPRIGTSMIFTRNSLFSSGKKLHLHGHRVHAFCPHSN